MRTALHNIGPAGRGVLAPGANRTQFDTDIRAASREIAQAIQSVLAPRIESITTAITNEYQRCEGLRANGARSSTRKPLTLPADIIELAPKGDDDVAITNQANVVRRGSFEGVRLANGTLVLKAED